MYINMGLKKRVIEYISPSVSEASFEWYEISDFIDKEYDSTGECDLSSKNPRFRDLASNFDVKTEKRQIVIGSCEILATKDFELAPPKRWDFW